MEGQDRDYLDEARWIFVSVSLQLCICESIVVVTPPFAEGFAWLVLGFPPIQVGWERVIRSFVRAHAAPSKRVLNDVISLARPRTAGTVAWQYGLVMWHLAAHVLFVTLFVSSMWGGGSSQFVLRRSSSKAWKLSVLMLLGLSCWWWPKPISCSGVI